MAKIMSQGRRGGEFMHMNGRASDSFCSVWSHDGDRPCVQLEFEGNGRRWSLCLDADESARLQRSMAMVKCETERTGG